MNDFIHRYQNIFVIGGLIILAFVAYSFFAPKGNSGALTVQNVDPAQGVVEQELLSLLLELRSIKLDVSLFADQRFQGLEDFSQDIVSEPIGRTNPFTPLGQ